MRARPVEYAQGGVVLSGAAWRVVAVLLLSPVGLAGAEVRSHADGEVIKGVRNHLCAAPEGPFRQMVPDPLSLPEGRGVEKVGQRCGICHGIEIVAQQRLGRSEWTRVVDQMIEFGAALTPDDRRDIVNYLSSYLGPDKPGD
jgi:hypothetical protein